MMFKNLLVFSILFHLNFAQIIRDTQCFLENGATASHLFVNENKKVGDIIGVLGVLGDPGIEGDIELRLKEFDSPVKIIPHSKNLTLVRPIDKEGKDGPASVFVNVICERRHTLDPGFVIPVNIRVTDANDNAPMFQNAPYVLNISEVTVVGTRVLQGVRALDLDQPGPFSTVQYAVLPGPHSDYFVFINALEGTLVLKKPLDYEKLSNFSVTIRAQDQGNPPQSSTTTLSVNVIDADDQNPAFSHEQYRIYVPSQVKSRTVLEAEPAPIQAVDQDIGINTPVKYSTQNGILPFLHLNSQTGEITLLRNLTSTELIGPTTIVIKATQIDNADRYALVTVIISRESSNEIPPVGKRIQLKFILKDFTVSVPEDTVPGSIILTMGINKINTNMRFWLEGASEEISKFSVTNAGKLILRESLDYEKKILYNFLVHVADGNDNDVANINIAVEDVNEWEPRFRHPRYEFYARTLQKGSTVGKVEAADGDRGDQVTLTLKGPDAKSFKLKNNGELILMSSGPFNSTLARLMAVATDSGIPSRTSMIPLVVHLPSTHLSSIASRAVPAWLNGSVFLIAVFGVVLGLLGIVILILILYIYKQKRPKNSGSVNSVGTGYKNKSTVPSVLNPSPQILAANALRDEMEGSTSIRQMPIYNRHKVAPLPVTPSLSATSNIPNIDGLVQNMNDLSARMNLDTVSQDSSNYSGDPPDSLIPAWPAENISRHTKKLSWSDNRTADTVGDTDAEVPNKSEFSVPEKLNLTVYF